VNRIITPAPIRKVLTVRATPQKAFRVFTQYHDRWWPRTHHIGEGALAKAVIEPRAGGRWYGVDDAGREEDWGEVLAWEPPHRLLLAWRINAKFECDPRVHTEVEVRFTDLGDDGCRVDFEHRSLGGLGEGALDTAARMDGGWGVILEHYKAAAES